MSNAQPVGETVCIIQPELNWISPEYAQKIRRELNDANIRASDLWIFTGNLRPSKFLSAKIRRISNIPSIIEEPRPDFFFGSMSACRVEDVRRRDDESSFVSEGAEMRSINEFPVVLLMPDYAIDSKNMFHMFTEIKRKHTSFSPIVFRRVWRKADNNKIVHRIIPGRLFPFIKNSDNFPFYFEMNAFVNTAPLIMQEIGRFTNTSSKFFESRVPVGVTEIMPLFVLEKEGVWPSWANFSAKCFAENNDFILEEGGSFKITKTGSLFLSRFHSKAYDPKFFNRVMSWESMGTKERSACETWIKTWSGRLRRHQARTWKADRALSRRIHELINSDSSLREKGAMTLSAENYKSFGTREIEVYKEFRSAIYALPFLQEKSWKHFPTKRSDFYLENSAAIRDARPISEDDVLRLCEGMSSSWIRGATAANEEVRLGACTPEAVVGTVVKREFQKESGKPFTDKDFHKGFPKHKNDPCFQKEKFVFFMPESSDRNQVEFARGAASLWHAVMGDITNDPDVSSIQNLAVTSIKIRY